MKSIFKWFDEAVSDPDLPYGPSARDIHGTGVQEGTPWWRTRRKLATHNFGYPRKNRINDLKLAFMDANTTFAADYADALYKQSPRNIKRISSRIALKFRRKI